MFLPAELPQDIFFSGFVPQGRATCCLDRCWVGVATQKQKKWNFGYLIAL